MPERFQLSYTDKNNKSRPPIIIHRVIYGSIERFIGILLEHTRGKLPLWLSPVQVRIINFTDKNNKACESLLNKLKELNIRADIDLNSEPLQGKIKQAEVEKVPYIVVIGNREEKSGDLAVRKNGKVTQINKDEFIGMVGKEIDRRE